MGLDMYFSLVTVEETKCCDESIKSKWYNAACINKADDLEKLMVKKSVKDACAKLLDEPSIGAGGMDKLCVSVKKTTEIEMGYFRKFNALHGYIVENFADGVDECQDIYMPVDKTKELVENLKTILDDNTKAAELLPVTVGFFFGSSEYDSYYFDDVREAYEMFTAALAIIGDRDEFTLKYRASW